MRFTVRIPERLAKTYEGATTDTTSYPEWWRKLIALAATPEDTPRGEGGA